MLFESFPMICEYGSRFFTINQTFRVSRGSHITGILKPIPSIKIRVGWVKLLTHSKYNSFFNKQRLKTDCFEIFFFSNPSLVRIDYWLNSVQQLMLNAHPSVNSLLVLPAVVNLKGLSSEIKGGSKVVPIDRSSFNLPTLRSGIQFHTSAILKFT
jgi:hypothetical protein